VDVARVGLAEPVVAKVVPYGVDLTRSGGIDVGSDLRLLTPAHVHLVVDRELEPGAGLAEAPLPQPVRVGVVPLPRDEELVEELLGLHVLQIAAEVRVTRVPSGRDG
jgi:hypothetical protein